MARGDYYDVWLRGESQPRRVQATRVGSSVEIDMGDAQQTGIGKSAGFNLPKEFVVVAELDKAHEAIRTFHFARVEVVAVEQGNEMIKTRKK